MAKYLKFNRSWLFSSIPFKVLDPTTWLFFYLQKLKLENFYTLAFCEYENDPAFIIIIVYKDPSTMLFCCKDRVIRLFKVNPDASRVFASWCPLFTFHHNYNYDVGTLVIYSINVINIYWSWFRFHYQRVNYFWSKIYVFYRQRDQDSISFVFHIFGGFTFTVNFYLNHMFHYVDQSVKLV